MRRAYLAGPDVFLPGARAHAEAKAAICARHGLLGLPPLNDDIEAVMRLPPDQAWRAIFAKDLELMEQADLVIANLTPFRGPSADAGTLVELGWFLGRARPIFAYSNTTTDFATRSHRHTAHSPDPIPGLTVEGFALPDNLMIPGALLATGHPIHLPTDGHDHPFDSLATFEHAVKTAAASP